MDCVLLLLRRRTDPVYCLSLLQLAIRINAVFARADRVTIPSKPVSERGTVLKVRTSRHFHLDDLTFSAIGTRSNVGADQIAATIGRERDVTGVPPNILKSALEITVDV